MALRGAIVEAEDKHDGRRWAINTLSTRLRGFAATRAEVCMAAAETQFGASNGRWELFPHGADIGVRGWGATLAQAFEQAALALTAAVTDADVREQAAVSVACSALDRELLLVEWLNAVIYEMAVRHMLFGRFFVTIEGAQLMATMWGEPIDRARHAPACEPKGATFTALRVALEGGRWSAACVVDV